MADEEKKEVPQGQPQEPAPAPVAEPKAETQEAPSISKDVYTGKSVEDVAKMHSELEKKLGESSQEVGKLRDFKEKMDVVLNVLGQDPTLYNQVDNAVRKYQGLATEPVETNQQPTLPVRDDTRRAVESQIIDEFERKYGINALPADKKKEQHQKIGASLAELLDPGGNKTVQQIIGDVPLDRLNRYLDHAYLLANRDQLVETAKLEALTKNREAEYGAIGGIPASGGTLSDITLTPAEREVARKQGIPEEKYLERKKQIATESKGV